MGSIPQFFTAEIIVMVPDWAFFEGSYRQVFLTKVAKIFGNICRFLKQVTFKAKDYFWATFGNGGLLFQHLVALDVINFNQLEWIELNIPTSKYKLYLSLLDDKMTLFCAF